MSASSHSTATLRPMLAADVPVLAAIYQASIDELTQDDYDEAQRAAWASAADDDHAFWTRLQACLILVATIKGAPVGFVALEGNAHVKMLYIYPPQARTGVGALLYDAIEKLAVGRGAKALTVDASDTARPFFETMGFAAQRRQTMQIGDQWLGNTHMRKVLGG